jgi:hypothetical protein
MDIAFIAPKFIAFLRVFLDIENLGERILFTTPSLLDNFRVTWLPGLVVERLEWSIET